jgi:hypothetical protein
MLPINKANHLVQWKIYYHDLDSPTYHRTWSNVDGPSNEAPVYGVICIIQPVEGGRFKEIIANADYYAIDEEGKWIGMNTAGVRDRQEHRLPFFSLKEGRWINTDRYQEILSRAHGDPDFGGDGTFRLVEI